MTRNALLLVFVVWFCVLASADPKQWKSINECDKEWNAWADRAMPNYRSISQYYDALKRKYEKLQGEEADLQSSVNHMWDVRTEINLLLTAVGIGVGIFGTFVAGRFLKRTWPLSSARRQLVVLIAGALWMSVAAFIGASNDVLSKHPVNLLFTVLVYSIPALAFGGIGFWWFGKAKPEEARQ